MLISHGISIIFPELVELIRDYKMILNYRHNYAAFPIFVYSKSEYTLESVSVSVRPSVRLHDNF
jgi:hypothetical protein